MPTQEDIERAGRWVDHFRNGIQVSIRNIRTARNDLARTDKRINTLETLVSRYSHFGDDNENLQEWKRDLRQARQKRGLITGHIEDMKSEIQKQRKLYHEWLAKSRQKASKALTGNERLFWERKLKEAARKFEEAKAKQTALQKHAENSKRELDRWEGELNKRIAAFNRVYETGGREGNHNALAAREIDPIRKGMQKAKLVHKMNERQIIVNRRAMQFAIEAIHMAKQKLGAR